MSRDEGRGARDEGHGPCVGRGFSLAGGKPQGSPYSGTHDTADDEALEALRRDLLQAREARQGVLDRLRGADGSIVFLSAGVPGPDKRRPGVLALWRHATAAVERALPATRLEAGRDAAGAWALFRVPRAPYLVKQVTVDLETSLPAGRLLDLDVYDSTGAQIDRASIHLPARSCLMCDRPSVECIRASRHSAADLSDAADRLLVRVLAPSLVAGARAELELTPKPGLVDRLDCGSHPDLSYEAMSRSIDLLPAYFEDLLDHDGRLDLAASVEAGRRAERRMVEAVGSNTHRGYIFLAGLVLLAARTGADPEDLRPRIAEMAGRILGPRIQPNAADSPAPLTHGARARADHGVGGIHREALLGLPSVFDRGLPVLASGDPAAPSTQHLLMAVLMQRVEDTTAVHRCGLEGLARLRSDGARLERLIGNGGAYRPWLAALNDEYRRLGLTMGGVADCMALCFALHDWLER